MAGSEQERCILLSTASRSARVCSALRRSAEGHTSAAVRPRLSRIFTSALASSKWIVASMSGFAAASISAVLPLASAASTGARCCNSQQTRSACRPATASANGLRPSLSAVLMAAAVVSAGPAAFTTSPSLALTSQAAKSNPAGWSATLAAARGRAALPERRRTPLPPRREPPRTGLVLLPALLPAFLPTVLRPRLPAQLLAALLPDILLTALLALIRLLATLSRLLATLARLPVLPLLLGRLLLRELVQLGLPDRLPPFDRMCWH
mmetsp:Transcript_73015/g.141259  ORF Transcript_73015/g.141259 Transcript_73015/m.141259 type:complete len:266 (-) Transcript_73015:1899-2696(-)